MTTPSAEALRFLTELYQTVKGDFNAKVSMYEIGLTLGMDKAEAGRVGEEVIALGWAEIKTLSGAIGITTEGAQAAHPEGASGGAPGMSLGRGPVLAGEGRAAAEKALEMIRERIGGLKAPYDALEEMVIDVKTGQVQLLSPRPKAAILREVLRSLQAALARAGAADTAAGIERMLD